MISYLTTVVILNLKYDKTTLKLGFLAKKKNRFKQNFCIFFCISFAIEKCENFRFFREIMVQSVSRIFREKRNLKRNEIPSKKKLGEYKTHIPRKKSFRGIYPARNIRRPNVWISFLKHYIKSVTGRTKKNSEYFKFIL